MEKFQCNQPVTRWLTGPFYPSILGMVAWVLGFDLCYPQFAYLVDRAVRSPIGIEISCSGASVELSGLPKCLLCSWVHYAKPESWKKRLTDSPQKNSFDHLDIGSLSHTECNESHWMQCVGIFMGHKYILILFPFWGEHPHSSLDFPGTGIFLFYAVTMRTRIGFISVGLEFIWLQSSSTLVNCPSSWFLWAVWGISHCHMSLKVNTLGLWLCPCGLLWQLCLPVKKGLNATMWHLPPQDHIIFTKIGSPNSSFLSRLKTL